MKFTSSAILSALLATAAWASPLTPKRSSCASEAAAYPQTFSVSNSHYQDLSFDVHAPATGACQLEVHFPPNYLISSTGNAQLNVRDLNGPAPGSLVGTITLSSDPTETTRKFINSFGCRTDAPMAYRFEIANSWTSGSVTFNPAANAGIFMTYNC